nr:MAG TPA_asm: NrdH [Caudoviricetes sp.]
MNESSLKNQNLKIYSADWCVKCRSLKNTLDRLGVSYDVVDISKLSEEEYASIRELPTIEFNNHRLSGEIHLKDLKEFLGL